jgi:lipopolysaccharide/colanic/teichoic acid biosynthesis glycosyltransferase
MKRLVDIFFVILFILLFWWLLLILICLVRWKIGKPVLFRQTRPGLNGVYFELIKFRTMTSEHGPDGLLLADSLRLTKFGNFLRSTSLDELPELWNVLKGEMSLVGPRPLLIEYLPLYTVEQAHRHDVRPGITGWAQINGRNAISWEDKFKLDLWYVNNQSHWLDVKILCITVKKVLLRDGINAVGESTASKFTGTKSHNY